MSPKAKIIIHAFLYVAASILFLWGGVSNMGIGDKRTALLYFVCLGFMVIFGALNLYRMIRDYKNK
ncbi:MAG: hypothetical protein Q4B73_01515 [Lachnospiraceae bacterium]|nr:hypothetical protein [Lachnospiraceae bacterium]